MRGSPGGGSFAPVAGAWGYGNGAWNRKMGGGMRFESTGKQRPLRYTINPGDGCENRVLFSRDSDVAVVAPLR